MNEWKDGSDVIIQYGGYSHMERIGKIKSVSKLKVVLYDGSEWRASDGDRWGSSRSGWERGPYIRTATQEQVQESIVRQRRRDMLSEIRSVKWDSLEDGALRSVLAALKGPTDGQREIKV